MHAAQTDSDMRLNQFKHKMLSTKKRNDYFWGYLLILPTVLGLFIFYIIPFFQTLFYSFTDLGSFGQYSWVGLENFRKMMTDQDVWQALFNTLLYTVITVPVGVCLSILVASLLNSKIKGIGIYRTLYFLPAVTMPAAIAMVWKWLYNSDYGLINSVLGKFSIKGPSWISDPKIAIYAVIIVGIWSCVGYNMVILLAGLQGISANYYEAADIDGAGVFRRFFNITLPLLTPTIFFVVIMSLISSFQVFDMIFMMITESSVAIGNTQSLVYLFYKSAFILQEKGYASAIAIMLFCIIMVITIIQIKFQNKWVHYE